MGVSPNSPIGIMDSGAGGLGVYKEIAAQAPAESVVYVGDYAYRRYGPKPASVVRERVLTIADYFVRSEGCKAVVIACNTATAAGLECLVKAYPETICLGVIESAVQEAVRATRNRRVGLIATEGTVSSCAHSNLMQRLAPAARLYPVPTPELGESVERMEILTDKTREMLKKYLAPLQEAGIDTLILGCTHYGFLRGPLEQALGPAVAIVDPAGEVVRQLKSLLFDRGLLATGGGTGRLTLLSTGATDRLRSVASNLLGLDCGEVEHVNLP